MINEIIETLELKGFKEVGFSQIQGTIYQLHNIKVMMLDSQAKIEVTMANDKMLFGTWTYDGAFLENLNKLTDTLLITY